MGQLDASIVSVAYPSLAKAFTVGPATVQWVGLSYLMVLVAAVAPLGRVADMVGRKLLYTYGFIVFAAGSAICAAAPNMATLDAFRALQAVGAAMMQANSVAIISHAAPPGRLGRAIGLQGAAQAVGLGLGPAVGGLLIAVGGWRLVFLVNVPVGILGVILGRYLIPRSRHLSARVAFDWTGLISFVVTIGAGLGALSVVGQSQVSVAVPSVLGIVSGASAILFIRSQSRTENPLIDLGLFRRSGFSVGIASALGSYLVLFGVLFMMPFYLESMNHQAAGRAGLELSVLPLALGVVAPVAGRWADGHGPRIPGFLGMSSIAGALAVFAATRPGPDATVTILAVLGAGLGAFISPNNTTVISAAPLPQRGLASGLLNTSRGLGAAIGLALAALFLQLDAGPATTQVSRSASTTAVVLAVLAGVVAVMSAAGMRSQPPRPTAMTEAA